MRKWIVAQISIIAIVVFGKLYVLAAEDVYTQLSEYILATIRPKLQNAEYIITPRAPIDAYKKFKELAQRLQPGDIVYGPFFSDMWVGLSVILKKQHLLGKVRFVSPLVGIESFYKSPNCYTTFPTTDQIAKIVYQFVKHFRYKKIAIIQDFFFPYTAELTVKIQRYLKKSAAYNLLVRDSDNDQIISKIASSLARYDLVILTYPYKGLLQRRAMNLIPSILIVLPIKINQNIPGVYQILPEVPIRQNVPKPYVDQYVELQLEYLNNKESGYYKYNFVIVSTDNNKIVFKP